MKLRERKSYLLVYLRAIRHPFGRKTMEYSLLVPLPTKRMNRNALSYRFWRVLVCGSLTRMSSTESSTCSSPEPMDLSGCFFKPSPNTSSSSSSSSGVRSLRRERRSSIWWARLERPSRHALWRNLSALYLPLLVLPGERKSIPSPLMALFSKFRRCRRHFLWWYTNCYTEFSILFANRYLPYVRFSYYFFVTEVPRATKLRRVVQKASRYTLISKSPFCLSVP